MLHVVSCCLTCGKKYFAETHGDDMRLPQNLPFT
jgi:hypothetical protein